MTTVARTASQSAPRWAASRSSLLPFRTYHHALHLNPALPAARSVALAVVLVAQVALLELTGNVLHLRLQTLSLPHVKTVAQRLPESHLPSHVCNLAVFQGYSLSQEGQYRLK